MGDPKTLTPGPWTPLRTGSMDCLTDRSTDYPYGPPLRTTPKTTELKINNNWKFVYTDCLDKPLLPVKSSRYAPQIRLKLRCCLFLHCWPEASKLSSSAILFRTEKSWSLRRLHKPAGEYDGEKKKIHIELTYYQSFSKDSGPQRRNAQHVINRLCTRAWALVCWICGALRLRFRRHEWHEWSIQTTGKSNLHFYVVLGWSV